MTTAVDSGRGAAPDMTSTESWASDPVSRTASVPVDELVAVLAKYHGKDTFLSDPNKRILYDLGAYDSDDEGAGEILGDILEAMNHTTPPHEDGEGGSLEDLQTQFEQLFLRPDAYPRPSSKSPVLSSSSSSSSFCSVENDAGKSSKK